MTELILKNQLRMLRLMKKMREDMILLAEAIVKIKEDLHNRTEGGQK